MLHWTFLRKVLLAIGFSAISALPEDWIPRQMNSLPGENQVFKGEEYEGEFTQLFDFQEIKLISNEWAVISARNALYVMHLTESENDPKNSSIQCNQVIKWMPEDPTHCNRITTPSMQNQCNNFIRIIAPISESQFLICGTNAKSPRCRKYEWDGGRFTKFLTAQNCTKQKNCVLDDVPSMAYVLSGKNLYMSSKIGYPHRAVIRRLCMMEDSVSFDPPLDVTSRGVTVEPAECVPSLETGKHDDNELKNPVFVSALDRKERILFFFRETAAEQYGGEEITFSRVAQVCKNDKGTNKKYKSTNIWTSYFKARLNCSFPGDKPFSFNEIHFTSGPHSINGRDIVFAVMSTPENSIFGSAVCAYDLAEVDNAMKGDFMKKTEVDGVPFYLANRIDRAPNTDRHPAACPFKNTDTRDFGNDVLNFRINHPLMHKAVQPVTNRPIFMRTEVKYLLTAIDAEVITALDGTNVTLLYIGTSDGHLLKVTILSIKRRRRYQAYKPKQRGIFVEEILVYDKTKCNQSVYRRNNYVNENYKKTKEAVLSVTSVPNKNIVLVAFRSCVIASRKHTCTEIKCRNACVKSGNPYCGWADEGCVLITDSNRHRVVQDLYSPMREPEDCVNTSTQTEAGDTDNTTSMTLCTNRGLLLAPVAVSLAAVFIFGLALFFVIRRFKKCLRDGKKSYTGNNDAHGESQGCNTNCKKIYKTPGESCSGLASSPNPSLTSSIHSYLTGSNSMFMGLSQSKSISRSNSLEVCSRGQKQQNTMYANTISSTHPCPRLDDEEVGCSLALDESSSQMLSKKMPPRKNDGCSASHRARDGSASVIQQTPSEFNPSVLTNDSSNNNVKSPVEHGQSMQATATPNSFHFKNGVLPKFPTNGFDAPTSPNSKQIVAHYSEVENKQNKTFRFNTSKISKSYSQTSEMESEKHIQERILPHADCNKSGLQSEKPTAMERGGKFSSFTNSHFISSWFPAPTSKHSTSPFTQKSPGRMASADHGLSDSRCDSEDTHNQTSQDRISFDSSQVNLSVNELDGTNEFDNEKNGKSNIFCNSEVISRSTDEGYSSEIFTHDESSSELVRQIADQHEHLQGACTFEDNANTKRPRFTCDSRNFCAEQVMDSTMMADYNNQCETEQMTRKKRGPLKNTDISKGSCTSNLSPNSPVRGDSFANAFHTLDRRRSNRIYSGATTNGQSCGSYLRGEILDSTKTTPNPPNSDAAQFAFHTMRPRGRMRQKLPRLQRLSNKSGANLKAVPTPRGTQV